jgi:hypothetical protein
MNVLPGAHRRAPRRSQFVALAAATVVAVLAGIAVWYTVKPADAATVQPGAYSGLGFDACAAPASADMDTWRASSPYRAIGVYIGGINRGCSQPNLTADWVDHQQAKGWHLFPLYVGYQASCNTSTTARKIVNSQAASLGQASGADAVSKAAALGLARNSLIIFDMEAYDSTDAACVAGVLAFMHGWTTTLHDNGYASGFYSSLSSGVADQIAGYSTLGYARPDYIDYAYWNNNQDVNDGVDPAYWGGHRRMKQYAGGHTETWGGVTITIDSDYLDMTPMSATTMGDFTANGFSDVLARNNTTGQLSLYTGQASTVDPARTIGTGWTSMNTIVRIGDWNRDGRDDILARETSTGYLWFYPGTGSGFGSRKKVGSGWGRMKEMTPIGDFTGDGVPDLVAVDATGTMWLYPGRSAISFGTKTRIGGGWNSMRELAGVGDFDRNGRPDLVARTSAGVLKLYSGKSGGFTAKDLQSGWGDRRDLIGVGDFDRDGYPDVAAVTTADGMLRLYRGTGTGFAAGSVALASGFGSRSLM